MHIKYAGARPLEIGLMCVPLEVAVALHTQALSLFAHCQRTVLLDNQQWFLVCCYSWINVQSQPLLLSLF